MSDKYRLVCQGGMTGDVFCNGDIHLRLSRIPDSKDGKDFRIVNLVCNCATRRPPIQASEVAPA